MLRTLEYNGVTYGYFPLPPGIAGGLSEYRHPHTLRAWRQRKQRRVEDVLVTWRDWQRRSGRKV